MRALVTYSVLCTRVWHKANTERQHRTGVGPIKEARSHFIERGSALGATLTNGGYAYERRLPTGVGNPMLSIRSTILDSWSPISWSARGPAQIAHFKPPAPRSAPTLSSIMGERRSSLLSTSCCSVRMFFPISLPDIASAVMRSALMQMMDEHRVSLRRLTRPEEQQPLTSELADSRSPAG